MKELLTITHVIFGLFAVVSTGLVAIKQPATRLLMLLAIVSNLGILVSGLSLLLFGTTVTRLCASFFAYGMYVSGVFLIRWMFREKSLGRRVLE